MVATSPVRHEPGVNMQGQPVEVQSYQTPWKALSEFALQGDMDQPHAPFQQLVSNFNILNNINTSAHSYGGRVVVNSGGGGGDGSDDNGKGQFGTNFVGSKRRSFDAMKNHIDSMDNRSPFSPTLHNFAREKFQPYGHPSLNDSRGYGYNPDIELNDYNHVAFQHPDLHRGPHHINNYINPGHLTPHHHDSLYGSLGALNTDEDESLKMMDEEDDTVVYLEDQ